MANNPALIKEVAAIAPLSFFLPSAPHALSARTAPVQAMIPVAPMKRHATSASALILPASLRYSSVQKVCRVCSRGNVRQDAKLPADEERGKVVSLRSADGNAQETTESHERRRMDGERRVERDASSIVEAGGEMADSDREPKGEHRTIGTSTFVRCSDERIKKDIVNVEDTKALVKLRQLQPKIYKYRDERDRGSIGVIGFIAQQIADVIPEASVRRIVSCQISWI